MVTFFLKHIKMSMTGVTRHGKVDSKRKNLEARSVTSVLIVKKKEKRGFIFITKRGKKAL